MAYQKITVGFVVQAFDDNDNAVSQEFIAGDEVSYESRDAEDFGEPHIPPVEDTYFPFDMIQPKENTNG